MLLRSAAAAMALTCLAQAAIAQDLTVAVQKVADSLDPATENSNVNLRTVYSL